jgi:hypothetical protein
MWRGHLLHPPERGVAERSEAGWVSARPGAGMPRLQTPDLLAESKTLADSSQMVRLYVASTCCLPRRLMTRSTSGSRAAASTFEHFSQVSFSCSSCTLRKTSSLEAAYLVTHRTSLFRLPGNPSVQKMVRPLFPRCKRVSRVIGATWLFWTRDREQNEPFRNAL